MLRQYGDSIPGFMERVGDDYARGHKEASGGIIPKVGHDIAQGSQTAGRIRSTR